jgi:hypothetical protein
LRCSIEYHDMARVNLNPARRRLGDSYFTPAHLDTINYEARTGRVPVRGAGYRGAFGGSGWDGMWTDMSEIVRPTRDGIHGREFISTSVDLGRKLPFLNVDGQGKVSAEGLETFSLPIPLLFDLPPASVLSPQLLRILMMAAEAARTLVIVPVEMANKFGFEGDHVVPLAGSEDAEALRGLRFTPQMIELRGWNEALFHEVESRFPQSTVCLRLDFGAGQELLERYAAGVRAFHLAANYHGEGRGGRFVLDLIREAHESLLKAGCRDSVTLLGSGGIIAAEHVPKAIICGLDAVTLDTPVLAALQAKFRGECVDRETSRFQLPRKMVAGWGAQRLVNLLVSWRDQLLEILGAMGLREVRRLRGEMGRAMFQKDLEREAFSGIEGYDQ